MKQQFLAGCLWLSLAVLPAGAAADFYVNDGIVLCPPQIPPQVDATNFVNNNFFSINFTNTLILPPVYSTANTRNFTNNGVMEVNTGFQFDYHDMVPAVKTHKMAANFVNNGTISAASAANTNLTFNFFVNLILAQPNLPKLQISATNVSLRSSTNIVGLDGQLSVSGKNVDLNRAYVAMEGFEENPPILPLLFFNTIGIPGMSAGYWGIGTNSGVLDPGLYFESTPPFTPFEFVQTSGGGFGFQQLVLPSPQFYLNAYAIGTNIFVQGVFVNNTNAAITNLVYFPIPGFAMVEWRGMQTNQVNGVITTNRMFLTDAFGRFTSNYVATNFSYYTAAGTGIPRDYSFSAVSPFANPGAPEIRTSPSGIFGFGSVTNEYSAFGAVFSPTTVALTNLPPLGRYVTNLPGRIQITADDTLDLSFARIVGLNYLGLKATNHVSGMGGAKISVPYSDINLATTNGNLTITNLLFPTVQRFTGQVDLWSGRWTNAGGIIYSVTVVDSHLSATAPSLLQDLALRSTNVVISDILNVTRNLMIDAQNVTVASNVPPSVVPTGQLNMLSGGITWSTSTPRLQHLTNNGSIRALNSVFFGGARSSPFYTSNYNEPYLSFVNRGAVTTEGSLIWANYFENSGQFNTGIGLGSISLSSTDARLTNGNFVALNGDISISAGSLSVTNHLLQAGRRLTLSVTNTLTDTGSSNANAWVVGRGFNLAVKPTTGDLLGTTITETIPPGTENTHNWAGEDRGAVVAGFQNNGALSYLTLDARGPDSLASFTGAGSNNALYVDYLDLRNYATNIDLQGNLTGVSLAGNMRIYYGQAVAGGVSVAERLNHANGDRLRWVSDYAGTYSGTNVVYPDGTTNRVNIAVVQSQNEDSDGDGLPNSADPSPVLLVTTASLPPATNGAAYSATLLNGGGVSPFNWSLASGVLPGGLTLSSSGVISGTPAEDGVFPVRVRVSQSPLGLFAERDLVLTVQPGVLMLSVAIVHHSPPGAEVTWRTPANATNSVYYRNSMVTGNWLLLTNFVSAVSGNVSIWDPVGTNVSRYYRVQISKP